MHTGWREKKKKKKDHTEFSASVLVYTMSQMSFFSFSLFPPHFNLFSAVGFTFILFFTINCAIQLEQFYMTSVSNSTAKTNK